MPAAWPRRPPRPRRPVPPVPSPPGSSRPSRPRSAATEALARGGPAPAFEETPVPAPVAGGAPSLADLVAAEADRLRRSGSPVAGFLADQLERVAQLVAFTGARSPQDFADRYEIHER